MKKLIVGCFLALGTITGFAQKDIKVISKSYEVAKISRTGLATTIKLDAKYVKGLWKQHLKNYGKVESKGKTFSIQIAEIPEISSTPIQLQSAVESSGKGTMVWLAIDLGDKHVTEDGEGYTATEEFLRKFALSCYQADLMEQVKDAEKALSSSTKKEEKTIKEGEKLSSSKERNAAEKDNLEQSLIDNEKEKKQLIADAEQNAKDKEAANKEVEKMKQALELKQKELAELK